MDHTKQLERRLTQSITDKLKNINTRSTKKKNNNNSTNAKKPRSQRSPRSANNANVLPGAYGSTARTYLKFLTGNQRYPGSLRIQGMEILSDMAFPTGLQGEVLLDQPISPSSFEGTRLKQFSEIYEKYLFRSLRFHYVPNVGTSAEGSIIMGYDRDIKDSLTNTLTNNRVLSSMQNAIQGPIWNKIIMNCPLSSPEDGFFTGGSLDDSDVRLSFQGRLFITNASGCVFTSSPGTVWLEYDADLFVPILERSAALAGNLLNYVLEVSDFDVAPTYPGLDIGLLSNIYTKGTYTQESNFDPMAMISPNFDLSNKYIYIPSNVDTALELDLLHVLQVSADPTTFPVWGTSGHFWPSGISAFAPRIFNSAGTDITDNLITFGQMAVKYINDLSTSLAWVIPGSYASPGYFRIVAQIAKLGYDVYLAYKTFSGGSFGFTVPTTLTNPARVEINSIEQLDSDLMAFYKDHKDEFVAKQRRIFNLVTKDTTSTCDHEKDNNNKVIISRSKSEELVEEKSGNPPIYPSTKAFNSSSKDSQSPGLRRPRG